MLSGLPAGWREGAQGINGSGEGESEQDGACPGVGESRGFLPAIFSVPHPFVAGFNRSRS